MTIDRRVPMSDIIDAGSVSAVRAARAASGSWELTLDVCDGLVSKERLATSS